MTNLLRSALNLLWIGGVLSFSSCKGGHVYGETYQEYKAFTTLKKAQKRKDEVRVLDLSKKDLTEIPPEVFTFKGLKVLNLSENSIRQLPTAIQELQQLEVLVLYKNQLEALPYEIAALKKLHTLILTKNNLKTFPYSLYTMTSLRLVHVMYNTSLRDEDVEHLRAILTDCVVYSEIIL